MEIKGENIRKVISGSPDWETDSIRALIEGACRVWQWTPLSRSATIKGGASQGTGTNVHRAHSAPTNPND
jgi:hypothetical protein